MIQLTKLKKSFAERTLFENLTLSISNNSKIGLVGRNGSGKSSLIKILNEELSADEGVITKSKGYSIANVKQHLTFTEDTIVREVMTALPKEQSYENYRAEKILFGLGFDEGDLDKDPLNLSGGQQVRVNLAKALIVEANLLLLDEPTNYLDIVGVRWLGQFLKNYPGEILMITHDRKFMDTVCNTVVGIYRKNLFKVNGSTTDFYKMISEGDESYEKTRVNHEKKIKEQMEFVNKNRAKARGASQAQSKLKQIEKMGSMEKLDHENKLNFNFNYDEIIAKTIGEVKKASFSYTSEPMVSNLSLNIQNNDKICIIGKNGKGKSTLLKMLANELEHSGEIKYHNDVKLGYFKQTNITDLVESNTIEQEITNANPYLEKSYIRSICGTMLFPGDDALKKIKILSGGEKSRVLLGKILATKTNLLFLDEPSNHLDQESIESLITELREYPGAVIMVTHNERILEELPTKLIAFVDGKIDIIEGDYKYFLNKVGWGDSIVEVEDKHSEKLTKKEIKTLKAQMLNERAKQTKFLKNKIEKLEVKIDSLENSIQSLNQQMIDASSGISNISIQETSIKLSNTEKELEELFETYELDSLELAAIEQNYNDKIAELDIL